MSTTIRLIPTVACDGSMNMALDEVTLSSAEAGRASLRFYTWKAPTLSLGYFQREADRLAHGPIGELPFVRRASGGGAIVHDRELTYCLTVPAGSEWHARESWLCRFHRVIASALAEFGVAARAVVCGQEKKLGEFLCFEHQTPGDLLVGSGKVVGSAQRRHRGALMQHGSILLEHSIHAPELPGIADLSGVNVAADAFVAFAIEELKTASDWEFVEEAMTSAEMEDAARLSKSKYRSDAWNRKR
jgi:lipoate-protein ligase A